MGFSHFTDITCPWGQNVGPRDFLPYFDCCNQGHPCFTNTVVPRNSKTLIDFGVWRSRSYWYIFCCILICCNAITQRVLSLLTSYTENYDRRTLSDFVVKGQGYSDIFYHTLLYRYSHISNSFEPSDFILMILVNNTKVEGNKRKIPIEFGVKGQVILTIILSCNTITQMGF